MTQTTVKPTPAPSDPAKKVRLVLWILMGVIVAAGLVWYAVFSANKPAPAAPQPAANAQLVREDSHRLTSPAVEKAQLVEFLDFECESCRAAHPLVEELKHGVRRPDHLREPLLSRCPVTGTRGLPLWPLKLPRSRESTSR